VTVSYVYEPLWKSPAKELRTSLNFYRDLIENLRDYDAMEIANYLSARDGIEWALKKLGCNIRPPVRAEIEQLDQRLKEAAEYLVNEVGIYDDISRDEPKAFWWWYLDEWLERQKGHKYAVIGRKVAMKAMRVKRK